MSYKVPMAGPDTPVLDLVEEITKHGEDCVVIVDDERKPLGIVTERDIISKVLVEERPSAQYLRHIFSRFETILRHIREGERSRARVARELMSSPAICADEDTSVPELAGIMVARGLRRLPVVRHGVVVGLVRRASLVQAIAEIYRTGRASAANP